MNTHSKWLRNFNIWTDGWVPNAKFKIHMEALQKYQSLPLLGVISWKKILFFCCLNDHSWKPLPIIDCTGPGIISLLVSPPGCWEELSLGSFPLKQAGICLQSKRSLVSPGKNLWKAHFHKNLSKFLFSHKSYPNSPPGCTCKARKKMVPLQRGWNDKKGGKKIFWYKKKCMNI